MTRSQRPTVRQIARLAGVSPSTVSNVLHERWKHVSPETRSRVLAVLEQVKYVPRFAHHRAGRPHGRILVLSGTRAPEPHRLHAALQETALHLGVDLGVWSGVSPGERARLDELLQWQQPTQIVLAWPEAAWARQIDLAGAAPAVVVDEQLLPGAQHQVLVDAETSTYHLVTHLLANDYRAITLACGHGDQPCPYASGARRALAGGDGRCLDVLDVGESAVERAEIMAVERAPAADRAAAFLFEDDLLAAAFLRRFCGHYQSMAPPFAVATVERRGVSPWLTPPLTSLAVPFAELAYLVVGLALASATSPHRPYALRLPFEVLVRASTSKPWTGDEATSDGEVPPGKGKTMERR